jgi:RNA polymerase sigma-70 factor (ECF subfamily)
MFALSSDRVSNVDSSGDHARRSRDRNEQSDEVLVGQLDQRCPAAFAALYARHAGPVFGAACRVLHDAGLAADVTQEVFVGLWRDRSHFDPCRGPLGPFLCVVARRKAIDLRRASASRRLREERLAKRDENSGADLSPFTGVWNAHVRAAVGALDASHRIPLELAFFGGHTYKEVARMLGEAEGTIKSRIRTGLHHLRSALASGDVISSVVGGR